jgi:hypothetical protein
VGGIVTIALVKQRLQRFVHRIDRTVSACRVGKP